MARGSILTNEDKAWLDSLQAAHTKAKADANKGVFKALWIRIYDEFRERHPLDITEDMIREHIAKKPSSNPDEAVVEIEHAWEVADMTVSNLVFIF
jgi:hypothetical protein